MKTTLRSFIFVLLAVAGGMALLAGNAWGADDALPPEVKALIGIKLPPVRVESKDIKRAPWAKPLPPDYVQLNRASIPGWSVYYGATFLQQSKPELGVEELYRGNLSIFVIDMIDQNEKSTTILDAQVLPQSDLEYFVKDDKLVLKKDAYMNSNYYRLNGHCKTEHFKTVVGLVRPEPGVAMGWSEHVKRAWAIDQKTGHITKISPQGVSCFVETGNE